MRRVRSQFLQSGFRLSSVVRGRKALAGAVVDSSQGSGAPFSVVAVLVALLAVLAAPAVGHAQTSDRALIDSFGTETGEGGGHIGFGTGVAVNRAGEGGAGAGDVYVGNWNNNRVEVFSALGSFVRAFGWDVVASGANDSGANETQTATVRATGGSFTLTVVTATAVGSTTTGSSTLTKVSGGLGAFHVGDAITGTGIPASTTVTCVAPSAGCTTPGTLTISQAATATGDERVLTARETTASISATAAAGGVESALNALAGIGTGGVAVTGGPGNATGSAPYSVTFSGGALAHDDLPAMTGASVAADPLTGGSPSSAVTVATPGGSDGGGKEICQASADLCKAGVALATAGSINRPEGLAVDQATGNVFVSSNANRRIDVFSATGMFQGAFGRGVISGGTGLEFCTTTCLAGVNAATAGAFATGGLLLSAITVAPDGHVYVGDRINRRINEFVPALGGSGQVTSMAFVRAFGWGVQPGAPAGLQTCFDDATGCQAGAASGGGDGQFTTNSPTSVAVDADGFIYAATAVGTCNAATNPCRIQKFNPDATFNSTFGPSSGGADACQTTWASGAGNAVGPYGLAIDPANQHVLVTVKTAATAMQLCELDQGGTLIDRSPSTPLATLTSGYQQVAIGTDGRVYINAPLAGGGVRGAIHRLGPVPPPTVTIAPVTNVGMTSATFNGTVTVPAPGFATTYHFEYSSNGIDWINVPDSDVSLGSTPGSNVVDEDVTGLAPNTAYSVRLVASTGPSATSASATFVTGSAPPGVGSMFTEDVTQTAATLGARVNPNSLATSYRIEWGTTAAYGNRTPAFDRPIGSGSGEVVVKESITGLQPGTTYHYRVVTTNYCHPTDSSDTTPSNVPCVTEGPDRTFETLNTCGLTGGRCYELVSPADKGPVGEGGATAHQGTELRFQAAEAGSEIAYVMAYGLPDATAGGEIVYRATREPVGWVSSQLTPPMLVPSPARLAQAIPAVFEGFTPNLGCAILTSPQPLSADAPAETTDAGQAHLYRQNRDGSYTLLTSLVPTNLNAGAVALLEYELVGVSDDCGRVVFTTEFQYPGVPGAGRDRLYEWDHGVLRNVGVVPGASGEQDAEATAGAISGVNWWRAMSSDARRVFFSAARPASAGVLPGEVGRTGVFVRKDGTQTVDVSKSQTATPAGNAEYHIASRNGRYVYFSANYGLAATSSTGPASCAASGAGCDLYRFDVETETLIDVSADTNPADTAGAGVVGVLDASNDGSHVYFAARGQLVPGEGRSYAQNLAANEYSVYLWRDDGSTDGETRYVGAIGGSLDGASGVLVDSSTKSSDSTWASRSTPDGRAVIFNSRADVTGYDSGGAIEVYHYDADLDETVCVSCRRDDQPSVNGANEEPLQNGSRIEYLLNPPRTLTADGDRVFFTKRDRLASGAVEGEKNLYMWESGQVSLLARSEPGFVKDLQFAGSSADGGDVFFTTMDSLVAEDFDGRMDVYSARVGGSLKPLPPVPPAPCEAAAGACQGSGAGVVDGQPVTGGAGAGGDAVSVRTRLSVAGLSRRARVRAARSGVLSLRVRTSKAGVVRVRARARIGGKTAGVGAKSVRVREAGVATVAVRLNRAARRKLASGRGLRVSLRVAQQGARVRAISVLLPGVKS